MVPDGAYRLQTSRAANPGLLPMTPLSQLRDSGDIVDTPSVHTTGHDAWQAFVTLRGEVDLSSCAGLRAELNHHLDEGRHVIRVDASDVTFVECRVLGELIRADQRCRAAGGVLILTRVSRPVQRLLQLTGLECQLLVDNAADERAESA